MTNHAEDERYQGDDFEVLNTTTESQISGSSSRLGRVESAIAKLESIDSVVNQVSLELQSTNKRLEAVEDVLPNSMW